MKNTIFLALLILLFHTIQAQEIYENIDQNDELNSLNIEADVLSGALSYNREIKSQLNIGMGLKLGYSVNLSYTESSFYQYNEILGIFLFNRFTLSNIFEVDFGVRAGYIQLVDENPKHGFSHLDFIGLYATPMIGVNRFKFGTSIAIGWTRELTSYISPISIRYKINF